MGDEERRIIAAVLHFRVTLFCQPLRRPRPFDVHQPTYRGGRDFGFRVSLGLFPLHISFSLVPLGRPFYAEVILTDSLLEVMEHSCIPYSLPGSVIDRSNCSSADTAHLDGEAGRGRGRGQPLILQ